MIELKKTKYEFNYDGGVISLSAPTVRDIEQLELTMKEQEATGGATISSTIDFLESLGLDREVAYKMEASNLQVIVESVSGTKND